MSRIVRIVSRLFFAILGLTAITTQFIVQIQNNDSIVNFFSFFTNLSNILAALVLLYSAYHLIRRKKPSVLHDSLRGAVFLYMTVVGVVFTLLLRETDLGSLLPWVNNVLHYILPVFIIVDFFYQPPSVILPKHIIKYWLIFPVAYLVYSLVRGPFTHFYPYPFINPANPGGYLSVGLYCLAVLVFFYLLGRVAVWLGNKLKRA